MTHATLFPDSVKLVYPATAYRASKMSGSQGTAVPANLRCMGNSAVQMRESLRRDAEATDAMLAASARNASYSSVR